MRNAYALLGLAFLLVFGGAYVLLSQDEHAESTDGVVQDVTTYRENTMSLTLTSTAFEPNAFIPAKYTCDGGNTTPPLQISGVPEGTKSFVLVMDDPDIPQEIKDSLDIEKFDHWAVYNIPPEVRSISEEVLFDSLGLNGRGEMAYTGPCPPSEFEPTTHRYIFRLYALTDVLTFSSTPTLDEIEQAAIGLTIENTELVGRYSRL